MANQQSSKGPSVIGQTIGPTAPVVAGEDNTGLVKPLQLDASGNLKVAVTGAGSGGTSSVDESAFSAGVSAGTPAMGAYQATPSTLSDGDLGIVGLTADRAMKVYLTGGGGSGGTSSAFGAAFPADGTAIGVADPDGTMAALSAETLDYDTGAGTVAQTIIGIALPGSGGPVAGGTNTNPIQVGDAGGSITVDGTVAATQSGTWNITNVSGTVSLPTGAATAALQTQPGVDIGDVTVNNGAGASAVNIQDGGNSITVDGTVAATQSGTWNITNVSGTVSLPTGASTLAEQQTQTTSLQLLDDVVATTASAIPSKGYAISGTDGTNARVIKTDTSGELQIDVLTLPSNASVNVAQLAGTTTDTNSGNKSNGTLRVVLATDQPTMTNAQPVSQSTASNLNAQVVGNVAHDAADSGNPVKVGGIAKTSLPTAVSADDRTNQITDVYGRAFVRHGAQGPAGNYWDVQHVPAANTQATGTQASAGAGVRNVCTGFTVTLASSSTTAPTAVQLTVAVIDGSSGGTTYLWRSVIALPAVAGAITSFVRSGLWLPGTAATAMTIEFSAAGGANTVESVTMEGTTVAE